MGGEAVSSDAVLCGNTTKQENTMGWQPIETAPDGKLLVVGYRVDYDRDTPERHDFDWKEDGVWRNHEDNVEYADAVAPPGSLMPTRKAPYQWWMDVPEFPPAA